MRVSLFLALSYLSTAVWAGGYQGCLERVWLFQAYEIDALYPEADRTIGFKCNKWNEVTHTCNVDWSPCKGKQAGGRCSFDELSFWLGKAPSRGGWADPSTGRLNTEDTAKKCVSKFTNQPGGGRAVPNPPPEKILKNTWEYNDYITKIGRKSTMRGRTRKPTSTSIYGRILTALERRLRLRAPETMAHSSLPEQMRSWVPQ